MDRHLVQFGDVLRQAAAFGIEAGHRIGRDRIARPAFGVAQHGFDAGEEVAGDRAGQDDAMDDAAAGDADPDFLHAQGGDGEDGLGRVDVGEDDQAGAVAGQHEHVGAWCAIEQRDKDAERQPGGHGKGQEFGRIHQRRDDRDREGGADDRADGAEDRLGNHRAGERLGHDVGGEEGPIGPFQANAERDIERQHRRQEAFDGE